MDGDLHSQLFDDSAPNDGDGDGGEPQVDHGDGESPANAAVHMSVLQAASRLITAWDESADTSPLFLPKFLTREDRASLHDFCEHRSLNHETVGDDGDRQLRVSRRGDGSGSSSDGSSSAGAELGDIFSLLAFNDEWRSVLVKIDACHWLAGWFSMAQSKASTLFKYFCIASSDAVFQVWGGGEDVQGSRACVKARLRVRFKQGAGVHMSDEAARSAEVARVDGLIKRVRRAYWRRHCRFSIVPPRELARRLLQACMCVCVLCSGCCRRACACACHVPCGFAFALRVPTDLPAALLFFSFFFGSYCRSTTSFEIWMILRPAGPSSVAARETTAIVPSASVSLRSSRKAHACSKRVINRVVTLMCSHADECNSLRLRVYR